MKRDNRQVSSNLSDEKHYSISLRTTVLQKFSGCTHNLDSINDVKNGRNPVSVLPFSSGLVTEIEIPL